MPRAAPAGALTSEVGCRAADLLDGAFDLVDEVGDGLVSVRGDSADLVQGVA